MNRQPRYFFCGIGGSGMLPLAQIVLARGAEVAGSDRSRDQGRSPEKFAALEAAGVRLFPQDGTGLTAGDQVLVTSTAVEETIPDVQAARRVGARHLTRAELLSELFNAAETRIGVAGTSGKSTVTAMIGWILHRAGRAPTVMNGAEMKNFGASALVGDGGLFVSEVDESDGSIALYRPTVAVVNNIALDHKSMEELRALFHAFAQAADAAVLNLDNPETYALADQLEDQPVRITAYGFDIEADVAGDDLRPLADGVAFVVRDRPGGPPIEVRLRVPGRHNASNALAAMAACKAVSVPIADSARTLADFQGVKRRLEVVGTAGEVTVIDDFAHNPDKIAATLETLHAHPGRLLVMWQPHGYGPLRLMKDPLANAFREGLEPGDRLLMPEPAYFGGTVDRSVGSGDLADAIGSRAEALPDRAACGERLLELARPGDRIVIMGARDDTLSTFAADLLTRLSADQAP